MTVKIRVNECVGCPPERGCLGAACPKRNMFEEHYFCDRCGSEIDEFELTETDGEQLCRECAGEMK